MKFNSLLFGSIGTLIETSELQRESFNEAFKEAGQIGIGIKRIIDYCLNNLVVQKE